MELLAGCIILQFVLIIILWGRVETHAAKIRDISYFLTLPENHTERGALLRRFIRDSE